MKFQKDAEVVNKQTNIICKFLEANAKWNAEFQRKEFRRYLRPESTHSQRLVSLLQEISLTQQEPNLEKLAEFWKIALKLEDRAPLSLLQLVRFFHRSGKPEGKIVAKRTPWHRLYSALKKSPGWGEKTAALFVRACILIHRDDSPEGKRLHFLADGIKQAANFQTGERIHLPVDAVIKEVFGFAELPVMPRSFSKINTYLRDTVRCTPDQVLLWDDLWFWGFLTQRVNKGKKKRKEGKAEAVGRSEPNVASREVADDAHEDLQPLPRTIGWNPQKFWCQRSMPWKEKAAVETLCKQFVEVLKQAQSLRDNASTPTTAK
ncbi:hypothetical protein [Variovorax boronicumulans]|uniref:hypothetical protein n=1 Tax=Variovorax boronicumulans TaxID=436515 RepID=UPI0012FD5461|nr:hypothetical protein [Variovorax boronicumulans]